MIKAVILALAVMAMVGGCASHESNSNAVMMDNVIGELDRETSK